MLIRNGKEDAADCNLGFRIPGRPDLTAKEWPGLLKEGNLPTIEVSLSYYFRSTEHYFGSEEENDSSSSHDGWEEKNFPGGHPKPRAQPGRAIEHANPIQMGNFMSRPPIPKPKGTYLYISIH